ncbi:ABC transporter substrate-binding protein/permease [Holzapfeliella floricola]|uniref:Amino acid ABC transporter permease n=1 Tax=Holzapfeliella floricola DSM 23037 = JCM 16512 TaxID=1423744 RepID=A0A0R2DHR5_9LACO|nr:ABC transporter substrate-binding protein/permease [Holzapfeliella floricola]KRN03631.1 amino acid ABC transporter permease [Holzapfeliella floricola DSM 23037 = JCM 16512]
MRSKKIVAEMSGVLALLIAVVMMLVNQPHIKAATVDEVKAKGELVMGTAPDYPPYEFLATVDGTQKVVGMDVQIGQDIANKLGVKLVVKAMDFDSLLVALETKKIDMVISGMSATEERKKSVDFSDPYYKSKQMFVIRKDEASELKSAEDIKDKVVGVQIGSMQQDILKSSFPQAKSSALTNVNDLLLSLKSNKVSAFLTESAVAEAYVSHNSDITSLSADVNEEDMSGTAIAFSKNSEDLVATANSAIKNITDNNLISKYLAAAGNYLESPSAQQQGPWQLVLSYWPYFFSGLGTTLLITIISIFFGVLLGVVFALFRISRFKLLNMVTAAFVEFIRGTPLMIQIMFVYFGVGAFVNIPALISGIIAVSINSAAYVSEIIRGGINSVPKGQTEAARSLGLSAKDTFTSVTFPQAIKNIWPSLGNEFISLIKETSIVSIIGVADLIYQLKAVQSVTYQGVIPIVIAMIIYFVITYSLTKLLNHFEGKMKHE